MPFKYFRITSLLFMLSFLLSACGGGSSDSSSSASAPTAQISSGSEFIEGTTFIDINGGNSSDSNGSVEAYQWSIEDNAGISSISITDNTSNSTQITGIPAVISVDIVITIGLVVTDNDGESSNKITKTITIRNNSAAVNVSNFDGIWYSPCFNNSLGFSARQTLNINGASLTSDITSHTAGTTPAPNCITPSTGITVFTDADATLSYGSNESASSCLNGQAVNTGVNISSVSSSGNTATSSSEIDDLLNLVTGYRDILPNNTLMCITDSGNLIFGGSVYTPDINNDNVDVVNVDINSDVTWQVGNNVYFAGASTSDMVVNSNSSFGVVVLGTDQDTSNGAFSGSSLAITHTLSGSGLYQIKEQIDVSADKQISISVNVGIGVTTGSTEYVSANELNSVEVIVDDNGKYHFTLGSVINLNKGVEVIGGVAGAPDIIDFTMNNIYDYSD